MNKKLVNYCQSITENKYEIQVINNEIFYPLIQSDDNSEWQLKLRLINTQDQLIQITSLQQIQQFLISDNNVKYVEIETIQKSKLGKLHKSKGNVIIDQGKNIGKKNQTTKLQQSLLFCDNKYEKMYNKKNKSCLIPHLMLLQTYKYKQAISCECLTDCSHKQNSSKKSIKALKFPQYIQRKYDGLRCCCITSFAKTYSKRNLINNAVMPEILQIHKQSQINDLSDIQELKQTIQEDVEESKEIKEMCEQSHIISCSLYSRGQKEFTNLNHIKQQLNLLLDNYYKKYGIIHQIMIDGEIYVQGINLQEINGIVKNLQKDSQQSNLYVFDVDVIDSQTNKQVQMIFKERLNILNQLQELILSMSIQNIKIVQTFIANDDQQIEQFLQQFLDEGHEGLVLRAPNSLYCYSINNKRSNDTMKYKPRFDTEVNIIDICEGIGKDKGAIIWICKYQNQVFNVVSNEQLNIRKSQFQSLSQNTYLLDVLKKIPYEIQYSTMSNDNIPQQPRGIRFRLEQITNNSDQISDEIFKQLQSISII